MTNTQAFIDCRIKDGSRINGSSALRIGRRRVSLNQGHWTRTALVVYKRSNARGRAAAHHVGNLRGSFVDDKRFHQPIKEASVR